jgi:GAF domain-containing protein
MNFNSLKDTILKQLDASNPQESLLNVCKLLNTNGKNYNWVGFYFMNHQTQELHLGPYVGKPTEHLIIPFGKGICGQVAVSGETYVADNVMEEGNYIACSLDVKSEIVVPIYANHKLVAQLDIDSDIVENFTKEDDAFLDEICSELGDLFGGKLSFTNFFSHE